MLIRDLALYLIGKGAGTSLGTDVFLSQLPDIPDACLALYDTGGMGRYAGTSDFRRTVKVIVRDPSLAAASARTWAILRELDGPDGVVLSVNGRKMATRAIQAPFLIERDSRNRAIMAVNLMVNTTGD